MDDMMIKRLFKILRSLHELHGELLDNSDSTRSSVLESNTIESLAHVDGGFTSNNIVLWLSFTFSLDHF